MENFYMLLAYL